jgi:hypothetical protein
MQNIDTRARIISQTYVHRSYATNFEHTSFACACNIFANIACIFNIHAQLQCVSYTRLQATVTCKMNGNRSDGVPVVNWYKSAVESRWKFPFLLHVALSARFVCNAMHIACIKHTTHTPKNRDLKHVRSLLNKSFISGFFFLLEQSRHADF